MNKQNQLLAAIISLLHLPSVAGDNIHNSTSAEYWLMHGLDSNNIKLSIDDANILRIELLGVTNPVYIPLPTLQMLGTAALDNLAVLICSTLVLAMSKCSGKGSERYHDTARLLSPIAAGHICPAQAAYRHKLLTGEGVGRGSAAKDYTQQLVDNNLEFLRQDVGGFDVVQWGESEGSLLSCTLSLDLIKTLASIGHLTREQDGTFKLLNKYGVVVRTTRKDDIPKAVSELDDSFNAVVIGYNCRFVGV